MNMVELPVKEIREDFFFCFRSPWRYNGEEANWLRHSIQQSGIRQPVTAYRDSRGVRLISGFLRYAAARDLGLSHIPCTLRESPERESAVFYDVLLEHRVLRPFSLVEKSRILGMLLSLEKTESETRDFHALLELPDAPDAVEEIRSLNGWPDPVLHYIETGALSLKQTRMFRSVDHQKKRFFVQLAGSLRVRAVELSQIMEWSLEAAHNRGEDVEDLFRHPTVAPVLAYEEWTHSQKTARLKDALFGLRYPRLARWRSDLNQAAGNMDLPSGTEVLWDRSLETPGVEMRARFRKPEDMAKLAEALKKRENQARLKAMLRIV